MRILNFIIPIVLWTGCIPTAFGQAALSVKAPEIKSRIWFNAGPYKKPIMKALLGKVVLIFFWTSNDTASEDAALFLNRWYSQYQHRGLEIIGVHTAEWTFDAAQSAVFGKIEALKIKYPVVLDEDSSIRIAYGQYLWPSFCLVDRGGYIRAQYSILSNYRDMETMLQTLLEEGRSEMMLKR